MLDTKFTKKAELSTFMLIYNPKTDSDNKPDVTVEYNFYAKAGGRARSSSTRRTPRALNAQTLPPQFDLAAGHQLQSGQAVSLTSFPEGEYRLEIKVTDKVANKTLTRDVNFSVVLVERSASAGRKRPDRSKNENQTRVRRRRSAS